MRLSRSPSLFVGGRVITTFLWPLTYAQTTSVSGIQLISWSHSFAGCNITALMAVLFTAMAQVSSHCSWTIKEIHIGAEHLEIRVGD